MLNYVAAYTAKVTHRPGEHILIFVKKFQQTLFFFWREGCASGNLLVGQIFVKGYSFGFCFLNILLLFVPLGLLEWWRFLVSLEDMYVPLSGGYASFYVSGQLLVASDGDNSFCSGYLHAQVKLVDHCFKLIDESSAKDCEVGVVHFHYIEGYMLCSRV